MTIRVSRKKPVETVADAGDGPTMPEATFLHIQAHGSPTIRMLELPFGPVRIGRAAHCEVRLVEPELGEVQCMLRRRGNTWHYQPVGPSGQVWIDGRLADQQRPLALGVPFRVGNHWLTLRPADSAVNDWGMTEPPIPVEIEVDAEQVIPSPEPPTDPQRARSASTPIDDEERLRRWQARLEQRERWLKDRQDERRWEARWKSAGESIRARTAPPSPPVSAPTRATPPPIPPPQPTLRTIQTPPVARIIEPRAAEPLRRAADPSPRPNPPRVPTRPESEPPAPIRRPVEPPTLGIEIRPARAEIGRSRPIEPRETPITRGLVTLPAPPVERTVAQPITSGPAAPIIIEPTREDTALGGGSAVTIESQVEPDLAPQPAGSIVIDQVERTPVLESVEVTAFLDTISVEVRIPTEETTIAGRRHELEEAEVIEAPAAPVDLEPSIERPEPQTPEPIRTRSAEIAPLTVVPAQPELPITGVKPEERETGIAPANPGLSRTEWPSAKAIFAAQQCRPQPSREASQPSRRRRAEPLPTDTLAPAQWSLPLWLGWFPVVLVTLLLGAGGTALAYGWAVESNNANLAMRLAFRAESSAGSTIDPSMIPRGSWWTSNATHLAAWAVALERAGDGVDHSEEVRTILNDARSSSQLSARARFILEPTDSSTAPGQPGDLSHLGRTRDVVSLIGAGRRLRKAGKLEASLRAYRSAMEIASRAGRADLDPPAFSDDPQVRRYALPHEMLIGLVALDMVEAGDWTQEQWLEALPPTASATLAVSRVLARSQKRGDADRLADLAIEQGATPTPPGFDAAEHRAAGAEALAYRRRWTDAAEQYRLAIDQVDDDLTRRMWWLNLAEVAQQAGDDTARARAIEAAKAPDSGDEVTKRALKYQQSLPGLASSSPRR